MTRRYICDYAHQLVGLFSYKEALKKQKVGEAPALHS